MKKVEKIEAIRNGVRRKFHPVTWNQMKEDPKTGEPHMGWTRISAQPEMVVAKQEVAIPPTVEKAIKAGRPKKEDVNSD